MPELSVGTRVRLKHDVERYPHFIAPGGWEGIVTENDDIVSVRMDNHLVGAEEWNNEIVWHESDRPMDDLEILLRAEKRTGLAAAAYQIAQIEALGMSIDVAIMHKGFRTPEKWIGVSVSGLQIAGDGLLTGVSGHGASVEEAIGNFFHKITNTGPDRYIVVRRHPDRPREAFRFDFTFGSWLRVQEELKES